MGTGICSLQDGGECVLYEHVHQYYITGAHQLGQILEVKGERQSTEMHEDEAVGAQLGVDLGRLRSSVGSVTGAAGVNDRHSRGQRGQGEMLPIQEACTSQRESLLQRGAGVVVLARLHHAGGLLCENCFPVAEGVTGQAGPSQRTAI